MAGSGVVDPAVEQDQIGPACWPRRGRAGTRKGAVTGGRWRSCARPLTGGAQRHAGPSIVAGAGRRHHPANGLA